MKIKIDGVELADFTVNDITFNYDAVSDTFAFTTPFSPDWAKDVKIFRPLKYAPVTICDNNDRVLLTGTILNHSFKSNSNSNEISLSGYSKTGVLDDCPNVIYNVNEAIAADEAKSYNESIAGFFGNVSSSSCYSNVTLAEFANMLVKPFGIAILVDDIVKDQLDEPYEQITTSASDTIASHLAKLATLKNVVMRSTALGNLRFTQIDPSLKPKVSFKTGDGVVTEISLQVNGQNMHSEIHVVSKVSLYEDQSEDEEKVGEKDVINNPFIGVYRPMIKEQGTESGMIKEVSKAALADELKNITVTIECKGWQIVDECILMPGDLISVMAPDVYLYDWTTLLVRSIQMKENAKEKSTSLSCVLPETMTGEQPKQIFGGSIWKDKRLFPGY